jgi:hypothetical protein
LISPNDKAVGRRLGIAMTAARDGQLSVFRPEKNMFQSR